jgi:drug/metabolite transporter (DMT)-like permease
MKKRYLFLLILGTAFWGLSFLVVQDGIHRIPIQTFLTYKFFIAATAIIILFPKKVKLINKSTIFSATIVGIILYLASYFQSKGLLYTSASNTAFITGLSVVFIPFLKYSFRSAPLSRKVVTT